MSTALDMNTGRDTSGELLFAADRSAKPQIIIPKDDGTTSRKGLAVGKVTIADGSPRSGLFSLDREGFSFLHSPSSVQNFEDDSEVEETYYKEIRKMVSDAIGAFEVEIFDHTIRVTDPETSYRRPASHAHNDYTEKSGPSRLRDMIGDVRADGWLQDRVVQINVWRPIAEPILQMPLALLDASSYDQSDLVTTEIINERQNGRVGQIYSVVNAPGQRWFYFNEMVKSDAILIKGYDSETDGRARFTPHSAFADPNTPENAPPRRSIEVRTFARVRR
ncbi:hypothetical protein N9L49_00875 [Rhodospirillales bacterium]|nr:hypothetical protein [Rhodospirillales bacterium]